MSRSSPSAAQCAAASGTRQLPPILAELQAEWIFAYGSLIWDCAGMVLARTEPARLHGYHRAFCIRSTLYRGTPESPGLVLGLDRGGSCQGMALQLDPAARLQSIERVHAREMPAGAEPVYLPRIVQVRLAGGERVPALTYVADRSRRSTYVRLPETEIIEHLATRHGRRGPNRDYAINTWEALLAHGVRDRRLDHIVERLRARPG